MNKCPICLDNINNKETTICNHDFCKECIDKWLETKNSCPICRTKLKEEEEEEVDQDFLDYVDEIIDEFINDLTEELRIERERTERLIFQIGLIVEIMRDLDNYRSD